MNNKKITILAIESSCDETACAVVSTDNGQLTTDNRLEILSNVVASQIDLHSKYGGVYPELASRTHAEQIIPTILESLENVKSTPNDKKNEELLLDGARSVKSMMEEIDAVAVTYGPGLVGSLVVGLAAAKTLAYVFDKPILPINHWEGHIYSNFVGECQMPNFQCQKDANLPEFPAIILTVSGGHTNIILMKGHGDYEILGQTLDDAAGEAFDKVARLLGLGYPGGPAISARAETYNRQQTTDNRFELPRPMIHSGDFNFSFSGLKTAVLYKVRGMGEMSDDDKSMMAYEFQEAITDTLIIKTKKAIEKYRPKSICLTGGVSANKVLREKFVKLGESLDYQPTVHIPPFALTTDNAAMIGVAGYYNFISGKAKKWYDIGVEPNGLLVSSKLVS